MLQWQYRAGAGAGAKIMDKGGAKKEPEPNFGCTSHLFRGGRTPDITTTLWPPLDKKKGLAT